MSAAEQYDPVEIFAAAAITGARQWHLGFRSLHDVTDTLEAEARRAGFDTDFAQWIMATAFEPFRIKPMSDTDLEDDALYEPEHDSRERDDADARKGNGQAKQAEFPLLRFDDITLDTTRCAYSVKGLLPRRGLVVLWGPPKCGKSFKATDIGLHIALGWQYRGRRVQQATVVYIALEGRYGFPARIEAFKQRHGVQSAPFHLITKPLDLVRKADALVASIAAQLGNDRPGVVFLDTLNRSLVGSESKDEDMTAFIAAAGKIEEKFDCLVVIVHHCGIDATRPRGHTSLSGAVEVQIAVKRGRGGEVIATVELAKDMQEGTEIFSRLELVDLGVDPDGDPITSMVVLPTEATVSTAKSDTRWTASMQLLRRVLMTMLADSGKDVRPFSDGPTVRACDIELVRNEFHKQQPAEGETEKQKHNSRRQAFLRAIKAAQAKGVIASREIDGVQLIWLCQHEDLNKPGGPAGR